MSQSTVLTMQQLVGLAKGAGFTEEQAVIMAAIAAAESSRNYAAFNGVAPDLSYGLWQINMINKLGPDRRSKLKIASNDELFNPVINAKAANLVFRESGGKYTPWSVYTSGAYRQYLSEAQAARNAPPITSFDGVQVTPPTVRPPLAPTGPSTPPSSSPFNPQNFDPFTKKTPEKKFNNEYTKKFIEDLTVAMKAFREGTYVSLWGNLKVSGETAFKSTLDAYNTSKGVPPTGAFPIKLKMTIDGISGIYNRQHFRIQEGILPKSYDNCAFIITGLEDSVSNNRWTTTIDTYYYDLGMRSQKEIDEAKKKLEEGFYVEPPKTSESTPKENKNSPPNLPPGPTGFL